MELKTSFVSAPSASDTSLTWSNLCSVSFQNEREVCLMKFSWRLVTNVTPWKKEHVHSLLKQRRPCPEEDAHFLSQITWWWQTSQFWNGWRQPLKYDDLADLNAVDKSKTIAPRFLKNWDRELKNAGLVSLRLLFIVSSI